MANSVNQKIKWEATNVDLTLSGQPADESLSIPVNQKGTVTISGNGITTVSPDSATQKTDVAGNNYYEHSIAFTWPQNRNTEGSITGNLSAKVSKDATYLGESLPISLSGLTFTGVTNKSNMRGYNPSITVSVPKNISTNDKYGGTYVFYTDMFSKNSKFDSIRGIFQDFYNQDNPTGILTLSSSNDWITFSDSNNIVDKPKKINYSNGKFETSPYVVVSPHLPSVKYGTVSGTQILEKTNDISVNGGSVTVTSTNNKAGFTITPSDKSNAHVDARTGTVSFSFTKNDSKDANTLNGSFNVTQTAGSVDAKDPKITYNWNVSKGSESKLSTTSVSGNKIVLNYDSNDGTNSTMSGTQTCSDIKQGKNIKGYQDYTGEFYLYNDKISYTLGSNTSSHEDTIICNIDTDYVSSTNIKDQKQSILITQQGSNYTVNPTKTIKISVKDPNKNAEYTIPGTSNHPYLKLSTDNKNFSESINVTLISGNKDGVLSDNTLYYEFGNNKSVGSQGGGISGKCKLIQNTSQDIDHNGGSIPIELKFSDIEASPTTTYNVPEFKWKVSVESVSKGTQTGNVNLFNEFEAIQEAIPASVLSEATGNVKISSTSDKISFTPSKSFDISKDDNGTTKKTSIVVPTNDLLYDKYTVNHNADTKTISVGVNFDGGNKSEDRSFTVNLSSDEFDIYDNKNAKFKSIEISQSKEDIEGDVSFVCHGKVKIGDETSKNVSLSNGSFQYTLPSSNNPTYDKSTLGFTISKKENENIIASGEQITLTKTGTIKGNDGETISNMSISYSLSGAKYMDAKVNDTNSSSGSITISDVPGTKANISDAEYKYYWSNNDKVTWNYCGTGDSATASIPSNTGTASSSSISYTDTVNNGNETLTLYPFTMKHVSGSPTKEKTIYFKLSCSKSGVTDIEASKKQDGQTTSSSTTFTFSQADGTTNCSVTADDVTVSGKDPVTGPSTVTITTSTNDNYRIFKTTNDDIDIKGSISKTRDLNCGTISYFSIGDTSTDIGIKFDHITKYGNDYYIEADYNWKAVIKCDNNTSYIAFKTGSDTNGLVGPITMEYKVDGNDDTPWIILKDKTEYTTTFIPIDPTDIYVDSTQKKKISGRIRIGKDVVVGPTDYVFYYNVQKVSLTESVSISLSETSKTITAFDSQTWTVTATPSHTVSAKSGDITKDWTSNYDDPTVTWTSGSSTGSGNTHTLTAVQGTDANNTKSVSVTFTATGTCDTSKTDNVTATLKCYGKSYYNA